MLLRTFKLIVHDIIEQCRVMRRYYLTQQFWRTDLYLWYAYCFDNPYRLSRTYLQQSTAYSVQPYGETPLSQFDTLLQSLTLNEQDHFVDLGCGRGRLALWVRHRYGCQVSGIDINSHFIQRANTLCKQLQLSSLQFIHGDFLYAETLTLLQQASVVYMYGTCLDDQQLHTLIAHTTQYLKPYAQCISVSFLCNDYDPLRRFQQHQALPLHFPWGQTAVYIQRYIPSA